VSVLRDRIIRHDAGQQPGPAYHPHGTAATPMYMPHLSVDYANEQAVYGTVHPLVTADGAVIAARSPHAITSPHVALTVPAGRP
jgi:hypothetical protein